LEVARRGSRDECPPVKGSRSGRRSERGEGGLRGSGWAEVEVEGSIEIEGSRADRDSLMCERIIERSVRIAC